MKRKVFALVLVLAMAISISACANGGTSQSSSSQDTGNASDKPIRIGVLLDASGEFSNVGIQKIHTVRYTVDKMNKEGGILGRQIELVEYDCQSDITKYQEFTNRIIMEDNVDVVVGAVTSFHREAIRPIFEENKMLLLYAQQYEGGVASKYTLCFGVTPEHQVLPMVKDLIDQYGKRIYMVSVDFNVGTITCNWIRKEADKYGGEIIGEEYIPFEVSQFGSAISKIVAAKPDMLVTMMVGTNMGAFYEQWANEGLAGQVPLVSTVTICMDGEHLRFNPPALTDTYFLASFIEELDTPAAKAFVKAYRDMWPDDFYMGMETESTYVALNMYKQAVEKAGTTETEAVLAAFESGDIKFDGPGGMVVFEPDTHHTTRDVSLFHCNEKHEIERVRTYNSVESSSFMRAMGIDIRKDPPNKQFEP